MKNDVKTKDELIEMLGVHFEQFHHLPPLASRIFGILLIDGKTKGLSFDEVLAITEASKSSVSTNLNLLLRIGKITFYTKKGDRKKYFKPNNLSNRIKNHLLILESERNIFKAVQEYEKRNNIKLQNEIDEKGLKIYSNYLNHFEQLLKKSIKDLEKSEQTN